MIALAPAALAARTFGPEWFLPSIKELKEIYATRATLEAVLGFSPLLDGFYWSSTESNSLAAFTQDFSVDNCTVTLKTSTYAVRTVRAF